MRDMSTAMSDEVGKAVVFPALLVELDFLSAPARFWSGIGPLSWDGKVWAGAGELLQLGEIEEATDGTATVMTGTLAGVPSDLTGAIYADEWQGRVATLWIGMFDADWALIDDPVQIRTGVMDQISDSDDASTATFQLTVATAALDQGDNRSWRLTHEIQQQFYPGDDLLKYTTVLQAVPLRWGAASAPTVNIRALTAVALGR